MTRKTPNMKEKVAESKGNAKLAGKKKAKNKVNAEAKKLAEKQVMEIAANMPAGQGNAFLSTFNRYVSAVGTVRAGNKNKSSIRSEFKAMKVDMAAFDRVFKLYEMDPADVAARKATEALYEQHLGLNLSDDQKAIVKGVEESREHARAAMMNLNGGVAGKTAGSGTNNEDALIGHNSNAEPQGEAKAIPAGDSMPERNEGIGKDFRAAMPTDAAASAAIN